MCAVYLLMCLAFYFDVYRFPAAAKLDHNNSSPLRMLTEIKKELKTNDFDLDAVAMVSHFYASMECIDS
jgi:hypothetical protein